MKKYKGMTLIGFIFMLAIAGFFALMAMRLVPAYIEFFGLSKAMNQMATEPGMAERSITEIRNQLDFKASFQYVGDDTLRGTGANQPVRLERKDGRTNLVVEYEKRTPFVYNISFLTHFKKTVQLKGNVG